MSTDGTAQRLMQVWEEQGRKCRVAWTQNKDTCEKPNMGYGVAPRERGASNGDGAKSDKLDTIAATRSQTSLRTRMKTCAVWV